jgi:hypothetical protein
MNATSQAVCFASLGHSGDKIHLSVEAVLFTAFSSSLMYTYSLDDHLSRAMCIRTKPTSDGATYFITPGTTARLLGLKAKGLSAEEKWFKIYETVFPTIERPKSPYYLDESEFGLNIFFEMALAFGPRILSETLLKIPLASDHSMSLIAEKFS